MDNASLMRHYRIDSLAPNTFHDPFANEEEKNLSHRYSVLQLDPLSTTEIDEMMIPEDEDDPLGSGESTIRRLRGVGIDPSNVRSKAKYIISSKAFNSTAFLHDVHQKTDFRTLQNSIDYLSGSIESSSSALKILVKNNFDRFVSAKATLDTVYNEMKLNDRLTKESDYGISRLKNEMTIAQSTADKIWKPVMDTRNKGEKIRQTMLLLEKYKYQFGLPGDLQECIRKSNYDKFLREWKKGETLLVKNDKGKTEEEKAVFRKIWQEVMSITNKFVAELWIRVADEERSEDEKLEITKLLSELQNVREPISYRLQIEADILRKKITDSFDIHKTKLDISRRKELLTDPPTSNEAVPLLRAPYERKREGMNKNIDSRVVIQLWDNLIDILQELITEACSQISKFWALTTSLCEGKAIEANIPPKARAHYVALAESIVASFTSQAIEFFQLVSKASKPISTDAARQAASDRKSGSGDHPTFLPPHSNVLSAGRYLPIIMELITSAVDDVLAANISRAINESMIHCANTIREKLTRGLCLTWQQDSKHMHLLEDWQHVADNKDITSLPGSLHELQKYIIQAAQKIISAKPSESKVENPGKEKLVNAVKIQFLNSVYHTLDGLWKNTVSEVNKTKGPQYGNKSNSMTLRHQSQTAEEQMIDQQTLLTISNFEQLKTDVIPKVINQFENAFSITMTEDLNTMIEVLGQLDAKLFAAYSSPKVSQIASITKNGIVLSGIRWGTMEKPKGIAPWVQDALMYLAVTHAQVLATSPARVQRTLHYLVEVLAGEILKSFDQIDRFGVGGMLQATLEVEFIHQTLSFYTTPAAVETMQLVYVTIEKKYNGTSDLQKELVFVKKLLTSSRKATHVQFLCFKKPRIDRELSNASSHGSAADNSRNGSRRN